MRRLVWLTMSLSALTIAPLGAWAIGTSLTSPRRMRGVAVRASANSLTTHLDVNWMSEELRGLAGELNVMLARLEEAFQRLSAFSADTTHELHTPPTNLLAQTQVVLSRLRLLEDYREALHGNLEELGRLTAMVNDMLLLAKTDYSLLAPSRQALDLDTEVDSLLELYQPLVEDHDIHLLRKGSLSPPGDRGMLQRVLASLLDNALRFTVDGGEIRIRFSDRRLSVENQGPAIPLEHLPCLLDRLYCTDPARREGQGEHTGPGLAICRSIIQAHGDEIRCESADDWTRFVIDFARPRR